jgi:hypothetical protein
MFSPFLISLSSKCICLPLSHTVQQDVMPKLPYIIVLYMSTGYKGL